MFFEIRNFKKSENKCEFNKNKIFYLLVLYDDIQFIISSYIYCKPLSIVIIKCLKIAFITNKL